MSSSNELEDFEALLEENFNVFQFCNDLLKATNRNLESTELDFKTPMKKVSYDLNEVNKRINNIVKSNPSHIIKQMDEHKMSHELVHKSLKPSLEYLDMSYDRLNDEIIKPYEHALRVQSALSKIHQTSSILRDALIFLHLMRQITDASPLVENDFSTFQNALKLASLHSQIQKNLSGNANLRSLRLIKKYDAEVISVNRQQTLRYISDAFTKECLNNYRIKNNPENIEVLGNALFTLSQRDYISSLDRAIISKALSTNQVLGKTITSIRSFSTAMEDASKNGECILHLEESLWRVPVKNSNLMQLYLSHKKESSLTEIFWSRVSRSFKKDFEISFNRGGPVGKSLLNNAQQITNDIKKNMANLGGDDNGNNLRIMLQAVSILDRQNRN